MYRELHTASPLIDVRVFRNRAFSAASGAIGLTFLALFGSLFGLTQYLQLVHGYTPLSAGLRALPFAAAVMVTAPLSSKLVTRLGVRAIVPAGLTLMGGGLLMLTTMTPVTSYTFIAAGVAIMGAGMGLIMAPAGESIMSVLPPEQDRRGQRRERHGAGTRRKPRHRGHRQHHRLVVPARSGRQQPARAGCRGGTILHRRGRRHRGARRDFGAAGPAGRSPEFHHRHDDRVHRRGRHRRRRGHRGRGRTAATCGQGQRPAD